MGELKHCPFCGGKARVQENIFFDLSGTYGIVCLDCGCSTKQLYKTKEEAEKAWNRRAGEDG